MSKDKVKKSKSTKSYRYTAAEVAAKAKCSESYVKKIRSGKCDLNSDKAQLVIAIDDILYDSSNKLLQEVDRILNGCDMDEIIDVQEWARRWLQRLEMAVHNFDKGAIVALFEENEEMEINWSEDVPPSMVREYDTLVDEASDILL